MNRSLFAMLVLLAAQAPAYAQTEGPASDQPVSQQAETVPVIPVAQAEHDQASSTTESGNGVVRLDEIQVTATKRPESARAIPVSITAIKGEDLEKMGARDIRDFISQVPGITLQETSSGEAGARNITVRGVGPGDSTGSSGNSANQTVGQFIGDWPMTDPYSNLMTPDLDPYDLRSVEVLKGPQGTTFGASALNGAIRYVPDDPLLGQWSARAFGTGLAIHEGGKGASYGAALNVPVGDTFALRGVGVQQKQPGVYDNILLHEKDADRRDKWGARAMLRWEPLQDLHVAAIGLRQRAHQYAVLDADNGDGRLENDSQPGPSSINTIFELAGVDIRYDFDTLGTAVLQGSMQRKGAVLDLDAPVTGKQGVESLRAFANYRTKGHTVEARLVSPPGGKWKWIAGVFAMRYIADAHAEAYAPNPQALAVVLPLLPATLTSPRGIVAARTAVQPVAIERSIFGELSRTLGERWEVLLGLRHYGTRFSGVRNIVTASAVNDNAQFHQDEAGFNPKASLIFRPSDAIYSYFTVARGFQFGGANAPPAISLPFNNPATGVPVPVDFQPSKLWSRELGVRTTWLDRTLQLDMTLYDINWSDAQFGESTGGAVSSNYIANVGKVMSRGAEFSGVWSTPLPGVKLSAAASYTNAKTAKSYTKGDGTLVPSGADMPGTPHVQTSTTLAYTDYFSSFLSSTSLNHVYWSSAWSDIEHDARIYNFSTLGFFSSLSRPDLAGMPSLTLGITNLSDKRALMNFASNPTLGNSWVYGRPRTISLMLTVNFE